MRKVLSTAILPCMAVIILLASCQKKAADEVATTEDEVSQDIKDKIYALGFSSDEVSRVGDDYLVEGDILLSSQYLAETHERQLLRVGDEEQYHTTNLVTGLPRTIRVGLSTTLYNYNTIYWSAMVEALNRYNAVSGLQLTFTTASSNVDIGIYYGTGNFLASSGFPTNSGNPYSVVYVNAPAIGNQPQSTIATILAHEIGHCIGFRHTDYMNRSYSCGGSPVNEGASSYGAIHISGTPVGADPNSWMLACIGSGQNRPFNSNDVTALQTLY